MSAYYNEFDPKAAAWLRELVKRGLIADGVVDERSIAEVKGEELRGYERVHLFAGIGGWDYALSLAGWRGPVWTGSCPCQPFSTAGKGGGHADDRNLWPEMFRLIRECRPDRVFGEQVAGAVGYGWLDGVCTDLEGEGYATGAAVLGAHSVGAPHIRQRLYWVADAIGIRPQSGAEPRGEPSPQGQAEGEVGERERGRTNARGRGAVGGLADPEGSERRGADGAPIRRRGAPEVGGSSASRGLAQPQSERRSGRSHGHTLGEGERGGPETEAQGSGPARGLGNAERERGRGGAGVRGYAGDAIAPSPAMWDSGKWIDCRDGKRRRIPAEPELFPLAHGVPARVVRLRGYGNAICPQTAAEFVSAYMECRA